MISRAVFDESRLSKKINESKRGVDEGVCSRFHVSLEERTGTPIERAVESMPVHFFPSKKLASYFQRELFYTRCPTYDATINGAPIFFLVMLGKK